MTMFRAGSKIFAAVLAALVVIFAAYFFSSRREYSRTFSPCVKSFVCFWDVSGKLDSGESIDAAKFAIGFNTKDVSDALVALDTLHGILLDDGGRENESEIEFGSVDSVLQDVVDAVWSSGVLRAQGVFEAKPFSYDLFFRVVQRMFYGDLQLANAIVEYHFPRVLEVVNDTPSADLSVRDKSNNGVHHIITKLTVDDLFGFYDTLCTYEPLTSICETEDGGAFSVYNWLERVENWAGLDAAVNVNVYWTLRGNSIIWANREEFLEDIIRAESTPENIISGIDIAQNSQSIWREGMWMNLLAARVAASDLLSAAITLSQKEKSYAGFIAFPDLEERTERLRDGFSGWVHGGAMIAEFSAKDSSLGLKVAVTGNQEGSAEAKVFAHGFLRDILPEMKSVSDLHLKEFIAAEGVRKDAWKGVVWSETFSNLPVGTVKRMSLGLPEAVSVLMGSRLTW